MKTEICSMSTRCVTDFSDITVDGSRDIPLCHPQLIPWRKRLRVGGGGVVELDDGSCSNVEGTGFLHRRFAWMDSTDTGCGKANKQSN